MFKNVSRPWKKHSKRQKPFSLCSHVLEYFVLHVYCTHSIMYLVLSKGEKPGKTGGKTKKASILVLSPGQTAHDSQ